MNPEVSWFLVRRDGPTNQGEGTVCAIDRTEAQMRELQMSERPILFCYNQAFWTDTEHWPRPPRVGDRVRYSAATCLPTENLKAEFAQEFDQLIASILDSAEVP